MLVNLRFLLLYVLAAVLSGCSGLYERQAPAPVYDTHRNKMSRSVPKSVRPADRVPAMQTPREVVATKPLETFKPELRPIEAAPAPQTSISPDSSIGSPVSPIPESEVTDQTSTSASESSDFAEQTEPSTPETSEISPILPKTESPPQSVRSEPEVVVLTPFEPIEPPVSSSPAVGALVLAANENSRMGNVEVASSSIDRALKIEPRNPSLYYKLALLRLKQYKPQEAEDLAKKSALLAGHDRQLKKHSWLLIAHARELRKDYKGAKAARTKADNF